MIRHTTNATTRTRTRTRTASTRAQREPLLHRGDELASAESSLRYQIDRLIGQGGFGQVYTARRVGRSRTVPATLCIKVSRRIDAWIREAYVGQLLDGDSRAIAIYDAFVVTREDGTPLYCLALEYARHGDLNAYLQRTGRRWPERVARREIAGILQVLGKLHRGQLLHRDLTPLNVFVCDHARLKLGDFGITRHQNDKRGITVRTLNPLLAPSDIFAGAAPKWQARDDVYQVGQLLGMLIKGDASARLRAAEVRKLPCSDHLKEIIYRCIGERRKRYESANELIEALSHPPATLKSGALRTLQGAHLAFTGIFSKLRRDLERAARRAGAKVHGMPSIKTTVVVRGRPNALQAAGRDAGRKLMEIKRLREKGHRIVIISEPQFWRLAAK
jgi:serine/threonine protein kinase